MFGTVCAQAELSAYNIYLKIIFGTAICFSHGSVLPTKISLTKVDRPLKQHLLSHLTLPFPTVYACVKELTKEEFGYCWVSALPSNSTML